jgi:hypothetical protein
MVPDALLCDAPSDHARSSGQMTPMATDESRTAIGSWPKQLRAARNWRLPLHRGHGTPGATKGLLGNGPFVELGWVARSSRFMDPSTPAPCTRAKWLSSAAFRPAPSATVLVPTSASHRQPRRASPAEARRSGSDPLRRLPMVDQRIAVPLQLHECQRSGGARERWSVSPPARSRSWWGRKTTPYAVVRVSVQLRARTKPRSVKLTSCGGDHRSLVRIRVSRLCQRGPTSRPT